MEDDVVVDWSVALMTGAFFGLTLAVAGGIGMWLTLSAAAWGAWAAAVAWWSGLLLFLAGFYGAAAWAVRHQREAKA